MTQDRAIAIKAELLRFCEKNGLWVEVTDTRKPELKDIVIKISVRIDK